MTDARLDRLYTSARDVVVDPHDMEKRRRFVSLTFNIDRLAVSIVELGDRDPSRDLARLAGSRHPENSDGEVQRSETTELEALHLHPSGAAEGAGKP